MKRKPKLQVINPPLVPYWRFDSADGSVAVYIPNSEPLTIERANFLLDLAKQNLLKPSA